MDLVFDTHGFADVIVQYFSNRVFAGGQFLETPFLNRKCCNELNKIVQTFVEADSLGSIVVTSSFSFIELARKFDSIFGSTLTIPQFRAFINNPPEWLLIESIDEDIIMHFYSVPHSVVLPNGDTKPIEWPDAVPVATYYSRESAYLITNDQRIRSIVGIKFL
jgi:hypothetical protein